MILGKWELPPYAMLAPMAGVSDRALRELAMRFGAVACVGEMVSCKGLVQGSRKSAELMEIGPLEMPCAIQLFGDEPEPMARAAELAQQYSPAWLDINMGCPAPKIAGNRSGSAPDAGAGPGRKHYTRGEGGQQHPGHRQVPQGLG